MSARDKISEYCVRLMVHYKFFLYFTDLNDEDVIKALQTARRVGKTEEDEKKISVNDMETCFGFDVS